MLITSTPYAISLASASNVRPSVLQQASETVLDQAPEGWKVIRVKSYHFLSSLEQDDVNNRNISGPSVCTFSSWTHSPTEYVDI